MSIVDTISLCLCCLMVHLHCCLSCKCLLWTLFLCAFSVQWWTYIDARVSNVYSGHYLFVPLLFIGALTLTPEFQMSIVDTISLCLCCLMVHLHCCLSCKCLLWTLSLCAFSVQLWTYVDARVSNVYSGHYLFVPLLFIGALTLTPELQMSIVDTISLCLSCSAPSNWPNCTTLFGWPISGCSLASNS